MDWREAEQSFTDELMRMETIPQLFEDVVDRYDQAPAQRYKGGVYDRALADVAFPVAPEREYATLTYSEVGDVVRRLATGFREIGVEPGEKVAICASTRVEWALCDFALQAAGAVVTTIYTSSSAKQIKHLVSDPGATRVVVENKQLLENVATACDSDVMDTYISMDSIVSTGNSRGVDVCSLADIYQRGDGEFDRERYDDWVAAGDVDDLSSLVYTSGTTGQPKGVEMSHRNFRANINQLRKRVANRPDKPADIPTLSRGMNSLSFLPLAHIFERLAGHFLMFTAGVCVNYAESADSLKTDLNRINPEILTSVPRVYEKLYQTLQEESDSFLKSHIFNWAVAVSQEHQQTESPGQILEAKYSLAESLVFSSIHEALGGNLELLISGGGTLSAELCQLYRGMGLNIVEGYGLTETAPVVSVNPVENVQTGTIGVPLTGVETRIDERAVEDGVFTDTEGEVGELLVRGENVTEGYWNMPEKTDEAFTDGWFRTGDIVHVRDDGYVVFKERLKQLLVLSTGKNVAPAPIEDAFATSDVVDQCMVVGEREKMVSALIVPDFEGIMNWADSEGKVIPETPTEMCNDAVVRRRIQQAVNWVNLNFEEHETIKEFYLLSEPFTEENGFLTPSQKKKRPEIKREYDDLWQTK